MARRELSQTVIVLDLDDTLYSERAYVHSGMRHICDQLEFLLGIPSNEALQTALLSEDNDWIGTLRHLAGLPPSAQDSLLWLYRLHPPAIQLDAACARFVEHMQREAAAVVILTDGRIVTQRLKLRALGLSHLRAYISEQYQSEKPDAARFHAIERDYPASGYVYIGDNPKKDFLPGNAIGWTTIGLVGDGNIHSQAIDGVPENALPQYWIRDWNEIYPILC
jgi:putative hydrolase of the HAD superfamily